MICKAIAKTTDSTYDELIQLGLYIEQLTEYDILCYYHKYNSKLKKLFLILEYNGIYIRKEFFEFVVNYRLINKHVMPIAYARKQLNKCNQWDEKAKQLSQDCKMDWNQLKKKFINKQTTDKEKKEIWAVSIPKPSLN